MDLTENLQIPYILPSQAQKHVTHNEAIKVLDAIVQLAVETRALATPPATPAPGGRYIRALIPGEGFHHQHDAIIFATQPPKVPAGSARSSTTLIWFSPGTVRSSEALS